MIQSQKATVFLAELPTDEEDPRRAETFRSLVHQSRLSEEAKKTVAELYRLAGTRRWASSLHDTNMLLYSLELNPALAPQLLASITGILQELPRVRVGRFLAWLEMRCGAAEPNGLMQALLD